MATKDTPSSLAAYVHQQLTAPNSKVKNKTPELRILENLFDTLYFTSMQTEEGQFIKVTITIVDPETIPEDDEENDRFDKWRLFKFDPPIPLDVKNLVKLSKAADPWSSSLAVYPDVSGKLAIIGMLDQTIHYQSYLNYENEDQQEHRGLIQSMVTGIGIIEVMLDYQRLATLQQDQLIKNYVNVFEFGPVAEFLQEKGKYGSKKLRSILGLEFNESKIDDYNEVAVSYHIQAISRILLRIRNYHHGGAILITTEFKEHITSKYKIKYDRIAKAVDHIIYALDEQDGIEDDMKPYRRKREMPVQLYEDHENNELILEEVYNEMIGGVRFAASLSCVDGLVLFSPQLRIYGFGTIITLEPRNADVLISKTGRVNLEKCTSVPASHFGTRHRSMFAYCAEHPDSVGFVISQDGEIRAIKNVDGNIIIWENIKVHQLQRSVKLPKPTAPRK